MHSYSLLAPAKINLYLQILGDRADGYHELSMILQSIELADQVHLRANGTTEFRVHCTHAEVPTDQSNLAYRAAILMATEFADAYNTLGGVDIVIDKRIPVGAGLAGGSTDAAAVLVGLDLMWNLGLTQVELQELAERLGSDVPFCVSGGTAIATGRGEKLAPLPTIEPLYVLLGKYRSLSVSTAWAYQTYRKQFQHTYFSDADRQAGKRPDVHSGSLVSAVNQRHRTQVGTLLHNDLEKVVLPAHSQVEHLRQAMQALQPLGTMMSGSGPTVFALVETLEQANAMRSQLQQTLPDSDLELWVTQFIAHGIQPIN
ncbi:MAG: 4-(cytidine 5'-diphospho)-2-C-methyl-D-erythritol kinase [Leptolyngbyaceae cyanobacterium SL_7_1]|nr:4-(cytidine 5'-diphospho)-2-C-methyl-D-erythritol kinase [Leptolyngbyaceae cyanobacterium SL_7_1]